MLLDSSEILQEGKSPHGTVLGLKAYCPNTRENTRVRYQDNQSPISNDETEIPQLHERSRSVRKFIHTKTAFWRDCSYDWTRSRGKHSKHIPISSNQEKVLNIPISSNQEKFLNCGARKTERSNWSQKGKSSEEN